MSSTQMSNEHATQTRTAVTVNLKLEVVVIPVSDVDRAKRFYEGLGWRLDADFAAGEDWRVVQMTPPGSPCSVIFGKGLTTAVPGSVQGTFLVVDDVEAARAELIGRGVDVSEVFHFEGSSSSVVGTKGRVPGRTRRVAPTSRGRHSAIRTATAGCSRKIKTRLPGRGFSNFDVATLTELLRETEEHHGEYEGDRSEAPLVGVVRRLHRRAPAREDSRGGGQGWRTPYGQRESMRVYIVHRDSRADPNERRTSHGVSMATTIGSGTVNRPTSTPASRTSASGSLIPGQVLRPC